MAPSYQRMLISCYKEILKSLKPNLDALLIANFFIAFFFDNRLAHKDSLKRSVEDDSMCWISLQQLKLFVQTILSSRQYTIPMTSHTSIKCKFVDCQLKRNILNLINFSFTFNKIYNVTDLNSL